MERNKLVTEVMKVLNENLNPQNLSEDTKLISDLQMNSLDTLEMVVALEDRFDINLDNDEIEKLVTVRDVVDYLEKLT